MSNASVEVWAVSDALTIPDGSSLRQEQEKLLDTATNPIPDTFVRDQDFRSLSQEKAGVQALVHTPNDWLDESQSFSYDFSGNLRYKVGEGISQPLHKLEPGKPHIVSCWDLRKSDGFGEDAIDNGWKGATTSCTVDIERIGPMGDVVSEQTRKSSHLFKTVWGFGVDRKKHHAIRWTPSEAGIYRITVHNSGASIQTWVHAGDFTDLSRTFEEDLKNEAGALADRAKQLADLRSQAQFEKITIQSNATGYWSADVPNGYDYVAVTARKGTYNGQDLLAGTALQDRSLGQFRAEWQSIVESELARYQDSDDLFAVPEIGTVYLSTQPKRVAVPSQNVTVEVRELSAPPYADGNLSTTWQDRLEDYFANQSYEQLQQFLDKTGLNASQIDSLEARLEASIEENEELRDRLAEWEDENRAIADDSRERLRAIERILMQYGSTPPGDTTTDVGEAVDGFVPIEIVQTYPADRFGDSLESGNWTVLAHDSGGATRVIPRENVTVERSRLTGEVRVTIEDSLPSDVAHTRYEILGISASEVARTPVNVDNPTVPGEAPSLDSIGVSTLHPGPDETVTMSLYPGEDSTYGSLTNATVYAPDGTTQQATLDGSSLSFKTAGAGSHAVVLTLTNTDGTEYTETIRVQAGKTDLPTQPGIRLKDTRFGLVALAADGFERATVDVSEDRSTVTVGGRLLADTDRSNGVHVYSTGVLSGDKQTIRVRVLDENGETLQQNVIVRIHHDVLSDPLVYRDGKPLDGDGTVAAGSTQSDVTTITVPTDDQGRVDVTIDRNPGRLDRLVYSIRAAIPNVDVPFVGSVHLPTLPTSVGGVGLAIPALGGVALVARGGRHD